MTYQKLHDLFKKHGIIFTLIVDPETLPFGFIPQFTLKATDNMSGISCTSKITELRTKTTHIHPDTLANEIWETLKDKKEHLVIREINGPTSIVQVKENTITITEITSD